LEVEVERVILGRVVGGDGSGAGMEPSRLPPRGVRGSTFIFLLMSRVGYLFKTMKKNVGVRV